MKNNPVILTLLSLSVLVMVSCSLISVLSPAPASAVSPTSTSTVQAPTAQPTQPATNTPPRPPVVKTDTSNLPLFTPTKTVIALPCDKAAFVADVETPDGSVFHPGDPVVRTWRLMNEGSCTWTTAYRLVFDRGYNFLGVKTVNLAKAIAPGETADISLKFNAPDPLGTYVSYWNLQGPAGTLFGTGLIGEVPLEIRIVIQPKPKK